MMMSRAEHLAKQRARARRWRAANKEHLRQYFERYRRDHAELATYQANYYRQNKGKWDQRRKSAASREWQRQYVRQFSERLNAARRAVRAADPQRVRAADRRRRLKWRDKKLVVDRQYRQLAREKYLASVARAKAKKPEHYRQLATGRAARRRARQRSAPVEPVSIQTVLDRDGCRCHLCDGVVARCERTLDHLIPVARRGAHAEWNLMVAHDRCNKRRGTKQILSEETREGAEAYIAARWTA